MQVPARSIDRNRLCRLLAMRTISRELRLSRETRPCKSAPNPALATPPRISARTRWLFEHDAPRSGRSAWRRRGCTEPEARYRDTKSSVSLKLIPIDAEILGLRHFALRQQDIDQIKAILRQRRMKLECLAQFGLGFGKPSLPKQVHAEPPMVVREFGLEPNCLACLGLGLNQPPLLLKRAAQIVVCNVRRRIKPDRLPEFGDRLVQLPFIFNTSASSRRHIVFFGSSRRASRCLSMASSNRPLSRSAIPSWNCAPHSADAARRPR